MPAWYSTAMHHLQRIIVVLTAFLLSSFSSFAAVVQIGETQILTSADNGNGNLILVQQATLNQTATLTSLNF